MKIQETTKTNKKFGISLSSTMTMTFGLNYEFDKNFVPGIGENSSIQTFEEKYFSYQYFGLKWQCIKIWIQARRLWIKKSKVEHHLWWKWEIKMSLGRLAMEVAEMVVARGAARSVRCKARDIWTGSRKRGERSQQWWWYWWLWQFQITKGRGWRCWRPLVLG